MAVFDGGAQPHTPVNYVNYLGAAASLALIVGIGYWSYDLIKRDVSGIPVVRAVQGDMRVAPEQPGGDIAVHTGLAVNEIAAVGEATEVGDSVALAPATVNLPQEDLEVQPAAEAGEVIPEVAISDTTEIAVVADPTDPAETAIAEALSAQDMQALADQIASGVEPIEASDEAVQPALAVDGVTVNDVIPASVPGVARSLRPVVRPNGSIAQLVAQAAAATPTLETRPSETQAAIPAGTHLVQLGAFPNSDDASNAWAKLQGQFGDFLVSKERVIQSTNSGGQTFYRLRAMGFSDLSDARRFCAALEARDVDCIPVVVR